jgi:DNA polymerase III subunit chi
MATVMFYHLARSGADDTLVTLLGRALAQGWRVMVRGGDPAALARLDDLIWTQPADAFVPHGIEGGAHDADQPILLGQGVAVNNPQGLALIDGATCDAAEAAMMERVWIIFDGANPAAVDGARDQWRQMTAAGLPAQYWSDAETGRWQMKMEKKPA